MHLLAPPHASAAACHPRRARATPTRQQVTACSSLAWGAHHQQARPLPRSQRRRHSYQAGHQAPPCCSLSRRGAVLSAAGGLWIAGGLAAAGAAAAAAAAAAAGGGFGGDNAQALVRTGMQKFRQNEVEASVQDFDRALALRPQKRPYLWQRGLSLYYLQQYEQAATQFRDDVAVNPNDTEESVWAFLCEAQLEGPDKARQNMLQVGRDPRPVMRAVYECFRTPGCSPDTILAAAGPDRGDGGGHDAFYALLYVALWHEAQGQAGRAREAMGAAVRTQYARLSGDYMADLARVHCQRRGWDAGGAGEAAGGA